MNEKKKIKASHSGILIVLFSLSNAFIIQFMYQLFMADDIFEIKVGIVFMVICVLLHDLACYLEKKAQVRLDQAYKDLKEANDQYEKHRKALLDSLPKN